MLCQSSLQCLFLQLFVDGLMYVIFVFVGDSFRICLCFFFCICRAGDSCRICVICIYLLVAVSNTFSVFQQGTVMVVIVWQLDLQLPVQSVSITTKVVSSNPVHGEVYSIQHYVIKIVNDLRQVGGFLPVLRFPPPIKLTATI